MKAELKHLHSPDVDFRTYMPDEEDLFCFFVQAMIGAAGSDASDSYGIIICTPRWFLDNCNEPMWGRHFLIVPRYDFEKIRGAIVKYVDSCEGKDWQSIAERLSRIGHWEFEDYRERSLQSHSIDLPNGKRAPDPP
jgi:hypothetical protein